MKSGVIRLTVVSNQRKWTSAKILGNNGLGRRNSTPLSVVAFLDLVHYFHVLYQGHLIGPDILYFGLLFLTYYPILCTFSWIAAMRESELDMLSFQTEILLYVAAHLLNGNLPC